MKDPKVAAMSKVPLFARCSKRELATIATLADEVDLPAGKVLATEGDRGREFFVVLEGSADVRHDGLDLPPLGAGDFFGEIALVLPSCIRTATVTASTPVDALVVTGQDFHSLLQRSPAIELKIMKAAAGRLGPAGL
jgi:CRP-like cAMP-binding protein